MNRAVNYPHKVLKVKSLTKTSFILRIEKKAIRFKAGQHINVGPDDNMLNREYSIYSSENDPYIEVLVKEVKDGAVSPKLGELKKGDIVLIEDPSGYFTLPFDYTIYSSLLFVATGTGIAPFHSFVKSYPKLNYHLIHGITDASEACERDFYGSLNLTLCTSQKQDGDFHGRVTQWLQQNDLSGYQHIYLCGNRNMINDAFTLLQEKGFPMENIRAEAYF
jgi:ferredoxin-NADP reductase